MPDDERPTIEPVRWGFATPGPLRDELTALAIGGGKVVTSSLFAEYEIDGDPVDQPGDISILLDSSERPLALIEDVLSKVIRLADMTDEDAIDEGEGYADATAFRVSHEEHWNGYIDEVREGLGDPGFTITDDTMIVVERFRIAGLLDSEGVPFDPPVRPAYPVDRERVDEFLAANNAAMVARLGELVDARRHPALIAEVDGELAGVLTWVLRGRSMELLTLHAARRRTGAGTALVGAARRVAGASGAQRLWLITTNDNVDALRFYQRRGFRLTNVHAGAVDRSRAALKPGIPETGDHGIEMHDELELAMTIASSDPVAAIADELLALELALARRDEAAIPGGYEAVLAADFTEIGASGRRWTRHETLDLLHADPPDMTISIEAFEVADLGPDLVLATYDAVGTGTDGAPRRNRRSSLWLRHGDRWEITFNQGTSVPPSQ